MFVIGGAPWCATRGMTTFVRVAAIRAQGTQGQTKGVHRQASPGEGANVRLWRQVRVESAGQQVLDVGWSQGLVGQVAG